MRWIKYFLSKKPVTLFLLALILAGGLFAYMKMGKLEDAPFTIKQALVITPYPGASPLEVQSQVTDILEESIQSLGELYYMKTENRAGLSKITVFVKKEIRAGEMEQLWDKLRRKVNDVQGKLPQGAGPSVVNDDFGEVLGVFYGLTGENRTYRELEDQAKHIKNELLKVKDVGRVEVYGGIPSPFIFTNGGGRILIVVWLVELVILGLLLANRSVQNTLKLQQEAAKLQKENNTARYTALQNQLNPHFLFNSLNTLIAEIEYNPDNAVRFTKHLSTVYRYVLQCQDKTLVTLAEELDFMRSYLFLHRVRLGECISCKENIFSGYAESMLPPAYVAVAGRKCDQTQFHHQ